MRLLANENVSRDTVETLRDRGVDVTWIASIRAGMNDRQVAMLAQRERRLLVTHDKYFGVAVYARGNRIPGVILIRLHDVPAGARAATLADAILGRDDWAGHFSVIEPGRVRMTPLRATRSTR